MNKVQINTRKQMPLTEYVLRLIGAVGFSVMFFSIVTTTVSKRNPISVITIHNQTYWRARYCEHRTDCARCGLCAVAS